MMLFDYLAAWVACGRERVRRATAESDRGDVPGWVMVTVMTAILVVVILGIFEPQIKDALAGIIDSISGSK
jgi:hypothetical protein